ncbi:hypothetical protein C0Q70_11759 [Pomacea canaliculata]|uniref:Calponin-homology (CH) domain-containing protein n=1 Tax=Pomacea canaliculata TaxID=400727 RepID=A0A2T7P6V6_POMCA|nr:hypothetical protein C0Q70_11759 [Pomacea canaliculata]
MFGKCTWFRCLGGATGGMEIFQYPALLPGGDHLHGMFNDKFKSKAGGSGGWPVTQCTAGTDRPSLVKIETRNEVCMDDVLTQPTIPTHRMMNSLIYTDWANHYLEKARNKKFITDLQHDIADGVLLAEVIEAVSFLAVRDVSISWDKMTSHHARLWHAVVRGEAVVPYSHREKNYDTVTQFLAQRLPVVSTSATPPSTTITTTVLVISFISHAPFPATTTKHEIALQLTPWGLVHEPTAHHYLRVYFPPIPTSSDVCQRSQTCVPASLADPM